MSISIVMPQLGLTMEEGTVSGWLKQPGDFVKKNEPLLTITTDKVEMEVESLFEGTLGEILIQPGETVPVGTVLAYLEGEGQDVGPVRSERSSANTLHEAEPQEQISAPAPVVLPTKSANSPDRASPRAKRMAKEIGVDISTLQGSGRAGEILEKDIRRASGPKTQAPAPNLRRRQIIAERLTQSIQTIPTFSVSAEANAEKLIATYQGLRESSTDEATGVTFTDLILAHFAAAIKSNPQIMATWEADAPKANSAIDIGLAIATAEGIVAPVLKGVDSLDLQSLAAARHALVNKARQNKLSLTDLAGGITTLSNMGMYRVDRFEAIITPGQSSVLAVGSIKNRPWVIGSKVVSKPTIILNLTVDHRIADGALGATFLGKLIELIEEPSESELAETLDKKRKVSK
jgi:pyruvate dehydrogenase E2 component (dihydrolipoamide acetyltransferase)